MSESDGMLLAPWTDDQVASLNAFQEYPDFHSFTCKCGQDLIAKHDGWHCPSCTYTQNWAHPWMANRVWEEHARAFCFPGYEEAPSGPSSVVITEDDGEVD